MKSVNFLLMSGLSLALSAFDGSRAFAQSLDNYTGFIERKVFRTWSEAPPMAGNAKVSTDFTESQTTIVRFERGRIAATYELDYVYDTKGSNSGAFMDGRCPVSTTTSDVEVQYFPQQGVPATASANFEQKNYRISVMFNDNAVGVRTAGSVKILNYNRGAKFCPDNPDRNESSAKDFIRAVDAITISEPWEGKSGLLEGSSVTPVTTINAKPGRIETGWTSLRWRLYGNGDVCQGMAADKVQYYKGLYTEINRVAAERNETVGQLIKVGMSDPAESTRLSNKRNDLTTRLRDLNDMNRGSPFYAGPNGNGMDAQAFASYGCGTKG